MATPKPETLAAFEAAKGFMPVREGLALYEAAAAAAALGLPLLEVGTYCGRSTILLADAAREAGVATITVDHHRGSEEQQPGWEYHDPTVVDPEIGLMDTLPTFRRTLHKAGLEDHVIAVVGRSPQVAAAWGGKLGFVFSSTAATPTSTPPATTRAGPRTWRRAAPWSSTTCSRTRPTAARPRTGSTCGPSPPAPSRRSPSPTRCACCAVPGPASRHPSVRGTKKPPCGPDRTEVMLLGSGVGAQCQYAPSWPLQSHCWARAPLDLEEFSISRHLPLLALTTFAAWPATT